MTSCCGFGVGTSGILRGRLAQGPGNRHDIPGALPRGVQVGVGAEAVPIESVEHLHDFHDLRRYDRELRDGTHVRPSAGLRLLYRLVVLVEHSTEVVEQDARHAVCEQEFALSDRFVQHCPSRRSVGLAARVHRGKLEVLSQLGLGLRHHITHPIQMSELVVQCAPELLSARGGRVHQDLTAALLPGEEFRPLNAVLQSQRMPA